VTDERPLGDLDYCYLTTTGRHTGSSHRIEIWFAIGDEDVYLLSGGGDRSDWVRNLMISPEVVLEVGDVKGRRRPGWSRIRRRMRKRGGSSPRSTGRATAGI
jgi:hypothetical protein